MMIVRYLVIVRSSRVEAVVARHSECKMGLYIARFEEAAVVTDYLKVVFLCHRRYHASRAWRGFFEIFDRSSICRRPQYRGRFKSMCYNEHCGDVMNSRWDISQI